MSLIIKFFILFAFLNFRQNGDKYKYILICTGHNCTPCVKTADVFIARNNMSYTIINLFETKADKQFTEELILNYCNESKNTKNKKVKDEFIFGNYKFSTNDNGPFMIKYSKTDTIIFNSLNIDEINN